MHGWRYPEALEPLLQRIAPRNIELFHGKIDLEKMHWGEKLIVKALRAKTGDFRNWEALEAQPCRRGLQCNGLANQRP